MNTRSLIITPVKIEERKGLDIRSGDTVRVSQKIKEKDKTRLQIFEGLVLSVKHGKEAGGTFTVRKIASGVGVERTFPIYSPSIEKIEIVKRSKVRQSKLYHIREKAAKEIKRQMRNIRDLPEIKSVDESQKSTEEDKGEETEEDLKKNSENPAEDVSEGEEQESVQEEEPVQSQK